MPPTTNHQQFHDKAGFDYYTEPELWGGGHKVFISLDDGPVQIAVIGRRNLTDNTLDLWRWSLLHYDRECHVNHKTAADAAYWAVWAWAVRAVVWPGGFFDALSSQADAA